MSERILRYRRSLLLAAVCLASVGWAARAETPTPPATAPEFEAVTIKPSSGASQHFAWTPSPTGYLGSNAPLARVIAQAYLGELVTPMERVQGAPAWVMSAPYDINAKADEATIRAMKSLNDDQRLTLEAPMLRAMLAERFKLEAHTAPVEVPGYALVVGRHGLKIKEVPPGEPPPTRGMSFGGSWKVLFVRGPDGKQTGEKYLQITLPELTAAFGQGLTPVVDQTGLTGRYDVELSFVDTGEADSSAPRPDVAHRYDWAALGLEMKPIKATRLTVVVDHIERPSEN